MAVPISNVTRRVVFAPSGTGPYAFTFEILSETDIEVYKGDTKLTLTTDYTVTINANGTGSVTLVATAGTDNITIIGARAIQRTTDFVTGGDFFANTVNTELDSLTIFAQQNAEAVTRALQAPETDPTTINMTLPRAADRAGKYLAFDVNGDPQPGDTAVDVGVVAGIVDDIAAVSAIASDVTTVADNDANVTTVAGISANITTVAGISSNVTTVATNNSNITTVATDLAGTDTIGTVAGAISNVNALGPIAADISTVAGIDSDVTAVAADATDIGTVAGSIADVSAVAAIAADVASVAADATDIGTVAGGIANVTTVAGSIANVNTAASNISAITTVASDLNEPVSEIETVANSISNVDALGPIASDISTVAGIAANVTTVAGVSANVTTVAGISANVTAVAGNTSNINAVAADATDIGTVATSISNVNSVAGSIANVNTVAAEVGVGGDVTVVATDLAGTDTVGTVAADIVNVGTVATNIASVNTVAGISADVSTVAADGTDIGAVAGVSTEVAALGPIAANITTVAGIDSDVTTVAGISANVTTVAGVAANVTTVAGIAADVTTVAADGADIGAVAAIDSDVTTVAGIAANVTTVAGISANVTSVANNSSNINQVAADTVAINAASTNATNAANSATAAAASAAAAAADAAAANAVSLGNEPVAPSIRPSLNLDFANVKALDPRITFTRTTTATYYDGVTTAKAEENLFLQSQDFTTSWANTGSTGAANTEVAPDGTTTADTVTATATTAIHGVNQTTASVTGTTRTFSLFAKGGTHNFVQLYFNGDSNVYANFNITSGAGAVGTVGAASSASIVDIGNGWYRCILTTSSATANNVAVVAMITSGTAVRAESWTAAGTETVYLWGAQLEQRSAVTAYTPTTTQPITNYVPVLQTAPAGVARFDHNPTTGESLGLLVEEQRTNVLLQSQNPNAGDSGGSTGWYSLARLTSQSNVAVAPNGTLTAAKFVPNTDNNSHFAANRTQGGTTVNTSPITLSAYLKAGELTTASFLIVEGTTYARNVVVYFDLANGTATTPSNTGGASSSSAKITPVGNGWYRCELTTTLGGTDTRVEIRIFATNSTTSQTFVGNNFDGIYFWGAQIEAGAFPTSYIATTTATVTRNADVASMTGTNFSSWYRADEGTIYAELQTTNFGASGNPTLYSINTDANNRIFVFVPITAQNYRTQITTSGSAELVQNIVSSTNIKDANKTVFAYKTNNSVSYGRNTNSDDTSCLIPVVDKLEFGASTGLTKYIRKLSFYPSRLSNAQLQALTTV